MSNKEKNVEENNFNKNHHKNNRKNEVFVKNEEKPFEKLRWKSVFLIKIYDNINNKSFYGSGFLIKLKKNKKTLNCLMSYEHVIKKQYIESKGNIEIFNSNHNLKIELDKDKRYIQDFLFLKLDAIIIEIIEKDFIDKNEFLLPSLEYLNGYSEFKNKTIGIYQYPQISSEINYEIFYDKGEITEINEYEYELAYLVNTDKGSSGSPIFIINDNKILRIHKQGDKPKKLNYGLFIWPIVYFLESDLQYVKMKITKEQ